jgi:hypothetical protein
MSRVLATAAVGLVALASGPSLGGTRPSLQVLDFTPLTLVGRDFKPHETVRLIASQDQITRVRKTRASASGSFRAAFLRFSVHPCRGDLVLRAVGAHGSRVTLRLLQPLSCPED